MLTDQVYTVCKKIPKGKVTTHKEIAKALNTKAYQAIDQALKRNPYAPEVPCHRVVSSTGNLHGFKGKRNGKAIEEKKYLLKKEGIEIKNNKIDLKKYLFSFLLVLNTVQALLQEQNVLQPQCLLKLSHNKEEGC